MASHPCTVKISAEEKKKKKKNHLTLVLYWVKKKAQRKKLYPASPKKVNQPPCQLPHVSPYYTRQKARLTNLRGCYRRKVTVPQQKMKTVPMFFTCVDSQDKKKAHKHSKRRKYPRRKTASVIKIEIKNLFERGSYYGLWATWTVWLTLGQFGSGSAAHPAWPTSPNPNGPGWVTCRTIANSSQHKLHISYKTAMLMACEPQFGHLFWALEIPNKYNFLTLEDEESYCSVQLDEASMV